MGTRRKQADQFIDAIGFKLSEAQAAKLRVDAMQIGTIEDGLDRIAYVLINGFDRNRASLDDLAEEVKSVVEALDAFHDVEPLTAEQSIPGESRLLDLLRDRQKLHQERVAQLGKTPSEEDGV